LEEQKKRAEEKTSTDPAPIVVPIPEKKISVENTLLPFDGGRDGRRRSSARTINSDVGIDRIMEQLEQVLRDFDTPATQALLESAFRDAGDDGEEDSAAVLKLEGTQAYIAAFFGENGLDVPDIKKVIRRQMFNEVMQGMQRIRPTDDPEGLDFEGAKVFMKKVLELVIGLPNEFYVMGSEFGDQPPVARPPTVPTRTNSSSMLTRMWQTAAARVGPAAQAGRRASSTNAAASPGGLEKPPSLLTHMRNRSTGNTPGALS
jgi:hypothetical protein